MGVFVERKVCSECKVEKPRAESVMRKYKNRTTPREWCIDCKGPATRRVHLKTMYGLTPERFAEILAAQGGGCAACHGPAGARGFVVDHDHACCPSSRSCGQCIRGLLCDRCNIALGMLLDDPARIVGLLEYATTEWCLGDTIPQRVLDMEAFLGVAA